MSTTKILLADDHAILRQGIRNLLEREPDLEVVAEAADGDEAVRLTNVFVPDVVIMDVGMPRLNGLEATKEIKATHPNVGVLVLTIHEDEEYVIGLLVAGATGYLLKSAYGEELVEAVRSVRMGDYVLHPVAGQRLVKRAAGFATKPAKRDGIEQFTPREIEVLTLAARGKTNKEIANELGISLRTTKGHFVNVFSKMRVSSRTEAVLRASRKGLIVLDEMLDEMI